MEKLDIQFMMVDSRFRVSGVRFQPSRRPKKRPVKSKEKLCHFGVVSYEHRRWPQASSLIGKEAIRMFHISATTLKVMKYLMQEGKSK
jgi:hypothetical protein